MFLHVALMFVGLLAGVAATYLYPRARKWTDAELNEAESIIAARRRRIGNAIGGTTKP